MKKSKFFLFVACMIATISANVASHAQGAGEIILYANANFGGQSVTVNVGTYPNISALGFLNNTASSIKVGSGVVAILHSCVDFGGGFSNGFRAYEGNDADFSNDGWPQGQNCGGSTVNNNVNALWVMSKNCVPGPDEASFYDHPNFLGGCVTVPAGSYASPTLAGMPNDWAGSLKVGNNVTAKIWLNSFQGSNFTYSQGSSISILGFGNNNLSSLVVDGCPNDPNKIEPGLCGCGVPETNSDEDNMPDCIDPDDDNDGITDLDETACGSNPLNAASTCEICDGLDNDLDEIVDEGFVNTDGDEAADCIDPDDDNDGCLDENDSNPLVAGSDSDCDGINDDCDVCPGGDDAVDNNGDNIPDCSQLLEYNQYAQAWKCGNNKLYICHVDELGNRNSICVNKNALPAHLGHGDWAGPCVGCAENISAPIGDRNIQVSEGQHLELYPNPAGDVLNFGLDKLQEAQELGFLMYNSLGQVVLQKDFGKASNFHEQIDLSALGNGLYIVSIKTGSLHFNQKLVVKRN